MRIPRFRAYLPAVAALVLVAAIAVSERVGMLDRFIIVALVGLWISVGLTLDAKRIAQGLLPLGIPVVIIILPFVHVVLPWGGWEYLFQALIVLLLVFYLSLLSARERLAVIQRAWPILLPVLLVDATVVLSYAVSDGLTKYDYYAVLSLVSATAFVPLAAIYCRSLAALRRLIYVVIIGGVLQLPIVLGQAAGLMDSLPGGLAQLSPAKSGGSLAGLSRTAASEFVARYPGSFSQQENLAEYCGIILLLCLGLLLFKRAGGMSWVLTLAAAAAAVTGWFTGTRAFVLGTAGGIVVLALGASLQPGPKVARIRRLAVGAALAVILIVLLVPQEVTSGFVSRFGNSDMRLSGPNAFNRFALFRTWVSLVPSMPVFGYGSHMLSVVQAAVGFKIVSPHSLYFSLLLTSGFLGLLAVLVMVVMAVFLPLRTAVMKVPAEYRQWGCIFLAVTLFWAVDQSKTQFLQPNFYVDFILLLLGIVASLFILSRDVAAAPKDHDQATLAGLTSTMNGMWANVSATRRMRRRDRPPAAAPQSGQVRGEP